jgi:hypothetical protein
VTSRGAGRSALRRSAFTPTASAHARRLRSASNRATMRVPTLGTKPHESVNNF